MNPLAACHGYLTKLPPAISGAGGHAATFRAACECVRFGLSDADALALLRDWNGTHCRPPWTEKELTHKLADARRVAVAACRMTQPRPAVRLVWKIERKPPPPAAPVVAKPAVPVAPPAVEYPPYLTKAGDLVIPFGSAARFHWWNGGQSPNVTREELMRNQAKGISFRAQSLRAGADRDLSL